MLPLLHMLVEYFDLLLVLLAEFRQIVQLISAPTRLNLALFVFNISIKIFHGGVVVRQDGISLQEITELSCCVSNLFELIFKISDKPLLASIAASFLALKEA